MHLLIGILSFLILVHVYKPCAAFWQRYKNNFALEKIPFTYMDGVFFFIASFLTTFFHRQIRASISEGIILLAIITGSFFLCWCILVLCGVGSPRPSPRPKKAATLDTFPDEPISNEDEDLLGRKEFVEELYNQIVNYPTEDPFVIGVYGVWGEGKTSVLNLLKNKLWKNQNIITYQFDPWYYSAKDDLIKGFYDGLSSVLNERFFVPNVKTLFNKYQKILSSGLRITGIHIDISLSPESLEELKTRIQKWISLIGKQIVILVDDIDRLENKNEILQIFKIIKLSGKFKKTIIVMSFDPNIISFYLNEEAPKGSPFLDKIIQNPIHLPAIDQSEIDKLIYWASPEDKHYSGIDRLFQKLAIAPERIKAFEKEFNDLYETEIKKLFPTLRHAKRYLNALYATLPSVKQEVDLRDFLILELIRVFYSDVYEDIWVHRWFYIPSSWDIKVSLMSPLGILNEGERYQAVKNHIEHVIAGKWENEVLFELLQTIFFVEVKNAFTKGGKTNHDEMAPTYRSEKRITHPEVFPKYFMLKVPQSDIPDEKVESLIDLWNGNEGDILESRLIDDLKGFKEKKILVELLRKINVFSFRLRPNTSRSIIHSIYKNIGFFSEERGINFLESEFDKALSLMLRLIDKKIESTQIQTVLAEIIRGTPSLTLGVKTVYFCQKERGGNLFNIFRYININELKQTLSKRLKEHFINGRKDIFEEQKDAFSLILSEWGAIGLEEKNDVNNYVFSLIDKNPKYISEIIGGFVINWGEPFAGEIRYNDLVKIYDENMLYEKVEKLYRTPVFGDEERSVIDLFIKTFKERKSLALEAAKREVNKNEFVDSLNRGRDWFTNHKFNEALDELNKALKIRDWTDEHNWMEQAKYEKWRCLLELSWNNGQMPIEAYFREATGLAGNEAQIKTLVESSYGDSPSDRAPIESYYCLFYYLAWHFSETERKSEIAELFAIHHKIVSADRVSGKSREIIERCDLMSKIISGSKTAPGGGSRR